MTEQPSNNSLPSFLNIDAVSEPLQRRLPHDDVIVLNLDDMSFVEQLRVITWCRVFIGVQGAALTWSAFLPINAQMVEITYDYWTARFKARARLWRPDLTTATVQCNVHTSDASFLSYARLAGM